MIQDSVTSKFLSGLALDLDIGEGNGHAHQWKVAKLILPRTSGYLVRADIIPLRMIDCPDVVSTISFPQARQRFSAFDQHEDAVPAFEDILCSAIAGVEVDTSDLDGCSDTFARLEAVEAQFRMRLSFNWILGDLIPKQTLVMVRGALRPPEHGGTGCNIYSTARALGIGIVVLDRPGHWLQDRRYAGLVEDFVPVNIDRDAGLPDRIVAAISQYAMHIDGITTFFETYAPLVAQAAQRLGLPTESPDALGVAADKYKTSIAAKHAAFRVSSEQDVQSLISSRQLQFPVIVKPCVGWSSEGVLRASDESQVMAAARFHRHESFVIEEYCDGPEVDANLILLEGELLFWEISDEFPKSGDLDGGTTGNFFEVANVMPSNLPKSELAVLCDSLHQTLLGIGFRNGMFHLEARVKDSQMKYKVTRGIMDMEPRTERRSAPGVGTGQECLKPSPSCWLIEINGRPPGIQASEAIIGAYGVDYVGLGLLIPLQDKERVRSLSVPYLNSPQYWSELVFIGSEKGGIFDSGDVCETLKKRRPDLARHISKSRCFLKNGDEVPPPSSDDALWIAYFVVFSRVSRRHVLELAEEVRSSAQVSISILD